MKRYCIIIMSLLISMVTHAMNTPLLSDVKSFPLHYAAAIGDFKTIKALTEGKADALQLLTQQDGLGRTPLHYAAAYGHEQIVSYIPVTLQGFYGENQEPVTLYLNQRDNAGRTAAQLALQYNRHTIVENLVFAKAEDPRIENTPIQLLPVQTSFSIHVREQPISISTLPNPVLPFNKPTCDNSSCTRCCPTLSHYLAKALFACMFLMILGLEFARHNHEFSRSDLD